MIDNNKIIKRSLVTFKELLNNDIYSAIVFNKAMEYLCVEVRHKYYSDKFLNNRLVDAKLEWTIGVDALNTLINGFNELDIKYPYVRIN